MTDLLVQIASTLIGGILLTLIFFLIKETFYRNHTLSGLWTFNTSTESTAYKLYKGMKLTYIVLIAQEGNRLIGTGEKVKEVTQTGSKDYEGKHRIQIQITGFITQRLFAADECVIHITEAGERRASSTIHTLRIRNSALMNGQFVSTIAAQTGSVNWSKGNDNYSFS